MQPTWVRFKDLHAVVPGIGDVDLPARTDLNSDRFVQVAGFKPHTAKLGQVSAIRIEHDHALFASVGHKHAPGLVNGNPTRTPEAVRQAIDFEHAPHPQELPIRCEDLDAVIPGVGDVDITIRPNRDTPGFVHQPSGNFSIHHVAITAKGIQE